MARNAALGVEAHDRWAFPRCEHIASSLAARGAAGIGPIIALHQAYAESHVWRSLRFRGDRRGSDGARSSRREQRALEPVDACLLSGQPKLAANVPVADAPEVFRTKRHDPAAFRASRRHGGNQADPGARRHQREDARELDN
jgi:hypothetical protein